MNAKHLSLLLPVAGICLVLAGVSIIAGCGGFDPIGAIGRALGGGDDCTQSRDCGGGGEEYSIAGLFWTWARILIGLGIVGVVASVFVPLIPTRACASVAGAGIACAIIAKFFAAYGWLVYTAFGVGAIVCIWPFIEAFRRWAVAKASGQPVKGHTGAEAIKQLIPFARKGKSNAPETAHPARSGAGGVVRPAQARSESD